MRLQNSKDSRKHVVLIWEKINPYGVKKSMAVEILLCKMGWVS